MNNPNFSKLPFEPANSCSWNPIKLTTFIVGSCMIITALVGLWNVERSHIDYVKLAEQAPQFTATHIDQSAQQYPLVAITGTLKINHTLGDDKHLIAGKYLQYTRTSEVYAWAEGHKPKHTHDEQGRSIVQPALTYHAIWTATPTPTETFKDPQGHENPTVDLETETKTLAAFKIGKYHVLPDGLTLPAAHQLSLSPATIDINPPEVITSNSIYLPQHPHTTIDAPLIGDTKTAYSVVAGHGKIVTIFGCVEENRIGSATLRQGNKLFGEITFQRLFWGTPDEAIAELAAERTSSILMGIIAAFNVMLLGFLALLSVTPLTKTPSRFSTFISAFFTALFCFGAAFILFNMMLAPFHAFELKRLLFGSR